MHGCQLGICDAKFDGRLAFLKSDLARENVVWHVHYSLDCFWPFLVALAEKNTAWHFLKTCLL